MKNKSAFSVSFIFSKKLPIFISCSSGILSKLFNFLIFSLIDVSKGILINSAIPELSIKTNSIVIWPVSEFNTVPSEPSIQGEGVTKARTSVRSFVSVFIKSLSLKKLL